MKPNVPRSTFSIAWCADKTMDVGPTVVRFIKHMKALKASDPFCTPATLYPGARIPTQCAVRTKRTLHHTCTYQIAVPLRVQTDFVA